MNCRYSLWIEAEQWADGWKPDDANSDVIVTFDNGERWAATFFSYKNILSLAEKNRDTDECLGGKYFCATDMILADEVSRPRIEEVVREMLEQGEFKIFFARCEDHPDDKGNCG
ncbi:MAG TPA: hypothetical protein VL866_05810 [Pyrinomonadaceae bacterium]|nr:hypothetical protein [Pyrinomonadaceae bacterium]